MSNDLECTITAIDAKGRGVAETPRGRVVVPFAIPGDTVRVALRGKRKGVWRSQVIERVGASPNRVEPRCPYVGTCGGCPWQMIDYGQQLRYKREAVRHALEGLPVPEIPEVLPCSEIFYYRNRMDYVIGPNGELGLKASEQWWNVLDLSTCFLLSPEAVEVMSRFRAWMTEHCVVPWDNQTHRGFARYLVIREGKRTNERMVMVVTAPGELPGREDLIMKLQPLATSILWGINPRITDLSIADEVHVLHGSENLHEELCLKTTSPSTSSGTTDAILPERAKRVEGSTTFRFAIPPNAFFQTNTLMAERLVETVREFAALTGTELVVDLYCGVGVFGIALAHGAARVIGVESDPSAIPIAQRNAIANGVTNAQFQLALAEKWPFPIDPIDVLIIDPPRAGLHPRVIQKILSLQPHRIIYVSCNPIALARDLKLLLARNLVSPPFHGREKVVTPITDSSRYVCDAIRCLDLFPHTYHVETVVALVKR